MTFCLLIRVLMDVAAEKKETIGLSGEYIRSLDRLIGKFEDLISTGDAIGPQPRIKISTTIDRNFRNYILMFDDRVISGT